MPADLTPPPTRLSATDSLFLDFDGTLVELADNPEAVHVSAALADRLDALAAHMPGRLAIVSGRSIAQLDALFGPQAQHFTLAGSHGAERRTPEDGHSQPERPAHLATATEEMQAVAQAHDLYFETKSFGAGLHYRRNPDAEPLALREAAAIAERHGLTLQPGKMMVEVRLPGDKGQAIETLMETPAMRGTVPIFLGDDVTDEDGFAAAAALGGAGVLVGPMRETAAHYRLPDVAAVHQWLARALENAE
ncbi:MULTISPECIES: trehalose-phosphatase [Sphingomonas]|nr:MULTISPECIES: trehalose-phosphatase [Sphingomonas]MBB4046739.1 trehalose 6-phosphate phosphatase [Sphingomonas zeae]MDK8184516.1 trehalose-phosphatase [Sphingomonas zeae]MDK8214395.1 trehalose-phosphatase [Sphingomonas sp. UMB7805-LC452B]